MTRRDWENLRHQLMAGSVGVQYKLWLESQEKKSIIALRDSRPEETALHEQTIGEMRAYGTTFSNFLSFVEEKIRTSATEETQQET